MRGYRYWGTLAASVVLAFILIATGIGKLVEHGSFLLNVEASKILPSAVAHAVSSCLPWIEIVLGVALIAGVMVQVVALISTLLSAAFMFHNSWLIAHGMGYKP
jgi:uncharacterized membrane protein YphA (DoxX/SURF4 family)